MAITQYPADVNLQKYFDGSNFKNEFIGQADTAVLTSGVYTDLINITGNGALKCITAEGIAGGSSTSRTVYLKITVDGTVIFEKKNTRTASTSLGGSSITVGTSSNLIYDDAVIGDSVLLPTIALKTKPRTVDIAELNGTTTATNAFLIYNLFEYIKFSTSLRIEGKLDYLAGDSDKFIRYYYQYFTN